MFRREAMLDMLDTEILLIGESLKNSRSAVCKIVLMTSEDIFNAYGDHIIGSLDPLGTEGIEAYGIDRLIQISVAQLSYQLSESRVAARFLLLKLQTAYEKSRASPPAVDVENPEMVFKLSSMLNLSP